MIEPMTVLGAFCLSYTVLFVLVLFFALVLCRGAAEADDLAAACQQTRRRQGWEENASER